MLKVQKALREIITFHMKDTLSREEMLLTLRGRHTEVTAAAAVRIYSLQSQQARCLSFHMLQACLNQRMFNFSLIHIKSVQVIGITLEQRLPPSCTHTCMYARHA